MAKKSYVKPVLFHAAYNVTEAQLDKLGVFNPTLNVDTRLFPDPLLLEDSGQPEMNAAKATFEDYFDKSGDWLREVNQAPTLPPRRRRTCFASLRSREPVSAMAKTALRAPAAESIWRSNSLRPRPK